MDKYINLRNQKQYPSWIFCAYTSILDDQVEEYLLLLHYLLQNSQQLLYRLMRRTSAVYS